MQWRWSQSWWNSGGLSFFPINREVNDFLLLPALDASLPSNGLPSPKIEAISINYKYFPVMT